MRNSLHILSVLFVITFSKNSFAENPKKVSDFMGSFFYEMKFGADAPILSRCLKLEKKNVKNYSKFSCSLANDEEAQKSSDWICESSDKKNRTFLNIAIGEKEKCLKMKKYIEDRF